MGNACSGSSNLPEESIGRAACQSPGNCEDEVPGTYTCVVAWNRCRYRETRLGVQRLPECEECPV